MKTINISDYNVSMGVLIDIRDKNISIIKPIKNAINIPYKDLIFNHNKYLNKTNTYYIICEKGNLSKKACNILNVYGYKVVNVVK